MSNVLRIMSTFEYVHTQIIVFYQSRAAAGFGWFPFPSDSRILIPVHTNTCSLTLTYLLVSWQ